jgi:hypothetical protein
MQEQGCGGKIPPRLEAPVRLVRLTQASRLQHRMQAGAVVWHSRGERMASDRRDQRTSVTPAAPATASALGDHGDLLTLG